MIPETQKQLWNDFVDLVDKYEGENSQELFAILTLFIARATFDYVPSREQATKLFQDSINMAWEWHRTEEEEKEIE